MIRCEACRRYLFLLLVFLLASELAAGDHPRIIPLRTTAVYPSGFPGSNWRSAIKATDGSTAYVLSMEPDFDIGHHLITLHLVLHHLRDKADAPNLLDPTGKRHGLQPYDFAAKYLARDSENSAVGEQRRISLEGLGLVLQMAVSKAKVSPIPAGQYRYQIDALELQIEVSNLNP